MHVNDFLTYIKNLEDLPYLRSRLLPVNMRLFKANPRYRALIQACCEYLRDVSLMDLEGYGRPFGMSGANLALPFNIVGLVRARGKALASCEILMNPEILNYEGPLSHVKSNCGSIRLPESIQVLRYERIRVRYCNETGEPLVRTFDHKWGAFTLQHEVDHNEGVLITDYGRVVPDADRPKT